MTLIAINLFLILSQISSSSASGNGNEYPKSLFNEKMKIIPESMNFNQQSVAKHFGNSSQRMEKNRKFRAAIGYGLTFQRELKQLEKILVMRGLVTNLFDTNDFQSQYFSSSRDDHVQKLIHNGITSKAITRYYTIQVDPTPEDLIDFEFLSGLNFHTTPAQGLCRVAIDCHNNRNIGNDVIEYRTADGSCNNQYFYNFGMATGGYWREVPSPPYYDDFVSSPRTRNLPPNIGFLPSARKVSTTLNPDFEESDPKYSIFMMQFGQFISHDFSSIAVARPLQKQFGLQCCSDTYAREPHLLHPECFPIKVDEKDDFYAQFGIKCLNFLRASPVDPIDCAPGLREQMNTATSYLDLHLVYGNNQERQLNLREFSGGKLKVSKIDENSEIFPPFFNDPNECSFPPTPTINGHNQCFKAGDERANMHVDLTTIHVIMLRMHNLIAKNLNKINYHWNDEKLFQESKRILAAMYQHVTYKEHLPNVLGPEIMAKYHLNVMDSGYSDGYSTLIDGSAGLAASTAAYRLHTLIRGRRKYVDGSHDINHAMNTSGNLFRISDFYFKPDLLYNKSSVDSILSGQLTQPMMNFDQFVSIYVAGQLFKKNPHFGMDLVAIDIQRGRDVGLSGYNSWLQFCGLEKFVDIDDMKRKFPADYVDLVKLLYANIDDVDFWPVASAERPVNDGIVGDTFACVAGQHFHRLKFGDRFWYENDRQEVAFTPTQLQEIRKVSMARIICDSTGLVNVQLNPFKLPDPVDNPVVPCNDYVSIPKPSLLAWKAF